MKFHNDNLDYTVGKYNNPYSLVQKAGKKRRTMRRFLRKTRRTVLKKTRKYRKNKNTSK